MLIYELRERLKGHVATIDQLRSEHQAAIKLHEVEKEKLKESISKTHVDELKEMRELFEAKEKELVEAKKITSERKQVIVDLNERLDASMQACTVAKEIIHKANETIHSQNTYISELKALIDEEKEQRKEDREKLSMLASIPKIKPEDEEESRLLLNASLRREKEQQEIINKLQESEKERRLLVETLVSRLEDSRHKLVVSENKVRQLESQLSQEQHVSSDGKKSMTRNEHIDHDLDEQIGSATPRQKHKRSSMIFARALEQNCSSGKAHFKWH